MCASVVSPLRGSTQMCHAARGHVRNCGIPMAIELFIARCHLPGRTFGTGAFPPDADQYRALADSNARAYLE